MKKIIKKLLYSTLIVSSLLVSNNINVKADEVPNVYSEGAILMDGTTGKIIYSKNENVQYEPASTTKVMTALIVLENVSLDEKVTIGEKPPLVDGSAIGIREGEVYTVEELMLGLLLESGNDCAEALAEYVAGSNEEFAVLMNNKAKELGALNTTFKNPSGLHEDGHLTTAYDLALIMREAANNEDFIRLARTESYKYINQPFSDGSEKWAVNRNQLLNEYSPYFYINTYCGKNGYTPEANHSYTAAAKKDDSLLIGAFLDATDKDNFYSNIGPLFEYGFNNFETVKLISENEVLDNININEETTIPLLASKDFYYTKAKTEDIPSYSIDYKETDLSEKSISKGDILFKAKININGVTEGTIDLISGSDIIYTPKFDIKNKFSEFIDNPSNIFFLVLFILFILFIIRQLKLYIVRKKLKRRRSKRRKY